MSHIPYVDLKVQGMMCMKNCGTTVQSALSAVPGVLRADVSFENASARIWGSANAQELIKAVEAVGFGASAVTPLPADGSLTLAVEGMMCQKNCGTTVYNALMAIAGVIKAEVSFADGTAVVWGTVPAAALINAVEAVGFGAQLAPLTLAVEGMMCQKSCGTTVQNALTAVPGVTRAEASLDTSSATVWGSATAAALVAAVEAVGFGATVSSGPAAHSKRLAKAASVSSGSKPVADMPTAAMQAPSLGKAQRRGVFSVGGMSCAACVRNVERAVSQLAGVQGVRVALLSEKAEVDFNPAMVAETDIAAAINGMGYKASHLRTIGESDTETGGGGGASVVTLAVTGMSCAACSAKIERTLAKLPGVVAAAVSVSTHRARITVDPSVPGAVGVRDLIAAVQGLGYGAEPLKRDGDVNVMQEAQERECAEWRRLFIAALLLTTPIMIIHMSMRDMSPMDGSVPHGGYCGGALDLPTIATLLLATPVQFWVARRFYRNAFSQALHGSFGMDMLVVVGTSSSYLYSFLALIVACSSTGFRPHLFFEASAMLITFITLGKYLESLAKGKTSQALTMLMKMQPHRATLVPDPRIAVKDGSVVSDVAEEKDIAIELVQPGDVLKVVPGSQIPADGVVLSGTTYVDESMITGEPMPVLRRAGDPVYGGTVNQNGVVLIQAQAVGGEALLAKITQLVEEAQMSKAPIQQYADAIAGAFTPTVMAISLLTFVGWYVAGYEEMIPQSWMKEEAQDPFLFALLFSISVMVVACPCALGLATPTAVMVGTGVGALNGLLIKGGAALERAHQVTTILFDKTGTLTTGKPILTDEVEFSLPPTREGQPATGSRGPHFVLSLAAACEQGSEHPVGQTILKAALNGGLRPQPVTDFAATPGKGVECRHALGRVLVGNRAIMLENGVVMSDEAEVTLARLQSQGKTAMLVALNGEALGAVAVADQPKREARSAVAALHSLGIKVWMVTGDNRQTAHHLASELGIPEHRVMAEVLPANKARQIAELQALGEVVAMVGDGINDSPALAAADVGIAVGVGTQVAIEAADMVLVRNNLHDVVVALHLSRTVFRRIRLNFVWAMVYNVCGIPFAAGLLYPFLHARLPPAFAGLSMACSSISVVLSSLSLRLYRRPSITDDGRVLKRSCMRSMLAGLQEGVVRATAGVARGARVIEQGQARFRVPRAAAKSPTFDENSVQRSKAVAYQKMKGPSARRRSSNLAPTESTTHLFTAAADESKVEHAVDSSLPRTPSDIGIEMGHFV